MILRMVFLGGTVFLSSCAELTKVPTINARSVKMKKNKTKVEGSLTAGGYEQSYYGYKPPQKDQIATGAVNPDEGGFLPDQVGDGVKIQGFMLPSDNDIVWSDDTNPDADINFDDAFEKPTKPRSLWFSSFQQAKRESLRTGKPMLIWFTRTGESGSPKCKKLRKELYERNDFKAWARENVIRVKVDLAPQVMERGPNGEMMDSDSRKRKYAEALKRKYRVLGLPSVIVESPSQGVMANYRGYRGDANGYFHDLKDNLLTHQHNYQIWKTKMRGKGYREWKGSNGMTIFAKLLRYWDGDLILVETDGNKVKTKELHLSKKDRMWIAQQKSLRARSH